MILEKPGQVGFNQKGSAGSKDSDTSQPTVLNPTSPSLKPDGDATADRTASGQQLRKYLSIFRRRLSV